MPEGGFTALDQVPSEFVELFRSQASAMASTTFSDWFAEYTEAATLDINPMPEGLPYAVDMTQYQSEAALESAGVDEGSASVEAPVDESGEDAASVEGVDEMTAEPQDGEQANGEPENGDQMQGEQLDDQQQNDDQFNDEQAPASTQNAPAQ